MDKLGDIICSHGLAKIETTQSKKDSNSHNLLGEDNHSHVQAKMQTKLIIVYVCSIKIGIIPQTNYIHPLSVHDKVKNCSREWHADYDRCDLPRLFSDFEFSLGMDSDMTQLNRFVHQVQTSQQGHISSLAIDKR